MLRLTRQFSKVWALTGAERKVLLAGLVFLPAFKMALAMWGLNKMLRVVHRTRLRTEEPLGSDEATTLARLVNVASFYSLGPSNCLTRSLYLLWLLRRHGISSDLRIGTRREDGHFEAHAWVEVDGQPVNDAPNISQQFTAFDKPLTPDITWSS